MIKVCSEFETKVDVLYNRRNEIVITVVSFCKPKEDSLRNFSFRTWYFAKFRNEFSEWTSAQLYNQIFRFDEIVYVNTLCSCHWRVGNIKKS